MKVFKNVSNIYRKQTKHPNKPKANHMEKSTMVMPLPHKTTSAKALQKPSDMECAKRKRKNHHQQHPQNNKITQIVHKYKNAALLPNKTEIKSVNP